MSAVLKRSFTDLVFDGRNKSFGAYFLRAVYQKHVLMALGFSASFLTLALVSPLIIKALFSEEVKETKMQMVEVVLEDIPSIEEKPETQQVEEEAQEVTKVKFLPPVVMPDAEVKVEEVPTTDDLKEANPGDETKQGNTLNEAVQTGNTDPAPAVPAPQDDKIYTWVEETAEFPGGVEDLKKFLVNNLKYPQEALNKQISDFVVLKFVINKDGLISDVRIQKSAGYGMDEEAVRVIMAMPKWKPARQNGSSVKLEKSIKIPFVLK